VRPDEAYIDRDGLQGGVVEREHKCRAFPKGTSAALG
jgi:hypothetical protein